MKLSKQVLQEKLRVPNNWQEMPPYKLIEELGLVTFPQAGLPLFTPLGQRIINRINTRLRSLANLEDMDELHLPRIYPTTLLEESGKLQEFEGEILKLQDPMDGYALTATTEEIVLSFLAGNLKSYRQLPLRSFKIQDAFRFVERPKGILKSREFTGFDVVSVDRDIPSYLASLESFYRIMNTLLVDLGVTPTVVKGEDSMSVEYLFKCSDGEKREQDSVTEVRLEEGRYSSLGMGYPYNRATNFPLSFNNADNTQEVPVVGTFGIGVQKCLHAAICANLDHLGIAFPEPVRPFDYSVLVVDSSAKDQQAFGESIYRQLKERDRSVYLDDRVSKKLGEKASFSDFLGVGTKLVVGEREVSSGNAYIKTRTGEVLSDDVNELLEGK